MRINKYLAEANVGSRRYCDKLVEQGKVTVNGKKAVLGATINEFYDKVFVEGKQVMRNNQHEYYMLHKPKGYVCTVSDDLGRKTIMDILPKDKGRLYPVGRLDYDTEGMLIVTNDGAMCERLTHPRNEVHKTYQAKIEGSVTEAGLAKLKAGVEIEPNVVVKAVSIRPISIAKEESKIDITISEGKNRQIRKMFEAIGKNVVFLKRVKIGDLRMTGVDRGKYRKLTAKEIEYLLGV